MGINVVYECDGCENKSDKIMLKSEFVGINGRNYGFGNRVFQEPKDHAPEGWIAYDLIGCCYCPACANDLGSNK